MRFFTERDREKFAEIHRKFSGLSRIEDTSLCEECEQSRVVCLSLNDFLMKTIHDVTTLTQSTASSRASVPAWCVDVALTKVYPADGKVLK